ncbi:MAG: carbonic anhydrase [Clostridia bacterium]|nr:carbonic anhydrase [Clostridia bacterium]
MQEKHLSTSDALAKLKCGNLIYINAKTSNGDISPQKRLLTSENGQKPYAVIIACSDSRVIPESIFSAGIGELFVVRVAGNVIDNNQLGSIEYAINSLGCRLVVVLGHTQCGAVGAAMRQNQGYIKFITDEIKLAIGEEVDPFKASILNIKRSVEKITSLIKDIDGLQITGAIYHTDSGIVDFDLD